MNLVDSAQAPVIAVVRGRYNTYFGDLAFQHPKIQRRAPISHITSRGHNERTVHFEDGTFETDVDHVIFGTGFSWTLPFLPQVATRNNRVPDLYQHVFYRHDPTLTFVGAVSSCDQTLRSSKIPNANNEMLGRCWFDLQGLRMAGCCRRSGTGWQGDLAVSGGTRKVGNRPHRSQDRWARVYST